jgi:RNA polymerase sigma-70 factor, ECF subfamily
MDEIVRLIEAEIPRLRRYARALLRDQDRADDLVQDTLLRGFDKVHLFRSGDLRAWLFTIMHNQYVNSVRRTVRQRETIVVEKVQLASPAPRLRDCPPDSRAAHDAAVGHARRDEVRRGCENLRCPGRHCAFAVEPGARRTATDDGGE